MTLIETVARLKELEGRRLAIIERAKDTGTPNHALMERIEIEQEMLDTFPKIRDVLEAFQTGDRLALGFAVSGEYDPIGCNCEDCQETTRVLNRLRWAARKMEAKQE